MNTSPFSTAYDVCRVRARQREATMSALLSSGSFGNCPNGTFRYRSGECTVVTPILPPEMYAAQQVEARIADLLRSVAVADQRAAILEFENASLKEKAALVPELQNCVSSLLMHIPPAAQPLTGWDID